MTAGTKPATDAEIERMLDDISQGRIIERSNTLSLIARIHQEREQAIRECAEICAAQSKEFLSPGYAANQPLGSFLERFAVEECTKAILALSTRESPYENDCRAEAAEKRIMELEERRDLDKVVLDEGIEIINELEASNKLLSERVAVLEGENTQLRSIVSESASAAGAYASPECSIEFMSAIPNEIVLAMRRARADRAEVNP